MTSMAEPATLKQLAVGQAKLRGDAIALVFEDRELSYAAFDARTNQVAHALAAHGVKPGERICCLAKNSERFFEIMFGACKAGVVLAPINWRLAPAEVGYILSDCAARLLFVDREFIDKAVAASSGLALEQMIVMDDSVGDLPTYTDWRDRHGDAEPAFEPDGEDIALQVYTSGTTGHPKGVLLSHRALLKRCAHQRAKLPAWNHWEASDVSVVTLPLFHIGGMGWTMCGLCAGAKSILVREFDPDLVLTLVEAHRVTQLSTVPSVLQTLVERAELRNVDCSRIKSIMYGGAPIPVELVKKSFAVLGCGLLHAYGMTETGLTIALAPEDHDMTGGARLRSIGHPLVGVGAKIVRTDGTEADPGEVGEILIRFAGNMSGYWRLPEVTAETVDQDGWLRTGDAAYRDEDGFFFIQDRLKDKIITGGENVYPAEVENAIFGHPAVAEVAVIGVPDARWGEAVKAVVVRRPGTDADEAGIIAWARERIAGFKVPKSVDFVDGLPRNANGKVLRKDLRAPYWSGLDRQVN